MIGSKWNGVNRIKREIKNDIKIAVIIITIMMQLIGIK